MNKKKTKFDRNYCSKIRIVYNYVYDLNKVVAAVLERADSFALRVSHVVVIIIIVTCFCLSSTSHMLLCVCSRHEFIYLRVSEKSSLISNSEKL